MSSTTVQQSSRTYQPVSPRHRCRCRWQMPLAVVRAFVVHLVSSVEQVAATRRLGHRCYLQMTLLSSTYRNGRLSASECASRQTDKQTVCLTNVYAAEVSLRRCWNKLWKRGVHFKFRPRAVRHSDARSIDVDIRGTPVDNGGGGHGLCDRYEKNTM